jgi:hypothetical protein
VRGLRAAEPLPDRAPSALRERQSLERSRILLTRWSIGAGEVLPPKSLRNIAYSRKTELRLERPVFLLLQVADLGLAELADYFAGARFAAARSARFATAQASQ